MAEVKPYNQGDKTKKEEVREMFDNIAPKYDLLNRVLSMGVDQSWRKKALSTMANQSPDLLLDLATGTGDLAIMATHRMSPKKVIGLDLSDGMLQIARKKTTARSLDDKISFQQGEAENLPFESNSFDAVMVAFGVRNFGHLEKGLQEINRVLKPQGQLVVLEFTKPRIFPFKQVYHSYFRYLLPTIGKLTSKDPKAYKYLYESVQAFPDYERFTDILVQNGYKNASHKALTLGICAIYSAFK